MPAFFLPVQTLLQVRLEHRIRSDFPGAGIRKFPEEA